MTDLNHVTLIGRLTRDAELKYTQSGTACTTFSIAVNKSYKKVPDHGGSTQQRCFCGAKTSGQAIFKKANGKRLFRTDRDVREIEQ